jgi:hypothetical protein
MPTLIKPGAGVLFMKVGTHARESLEDIIERKSREIAAVGYAFWGYGGNTCHPQTMVQPFAKSYEQRGQKVYLVMHPMESKHFAEQLRASDFSIDGIKWEPIPPAINVLGSRYALVVTNLRREEFDLPLHAAKVALGNSMGMPASKYITGRVDKACLEISADERIGSEASYKIGLVADLDDPYAVYVRGP